MGVRVDGVKYCFGSVIIKHRITSLNIAFTSWEAFKGQMQCLSRCFEL